MAEFSPQEYELQRKQSLALNVEAIRAGMFATATDMMEAMKEAGVIDADAALLDGSILFVTELWDNVMVGVGHAPSKSRNALLDNVKKGIETARKKRQAQLQTDS